MSSEPRPPSSDFSTPPVAGLAAQAENWVRRRDAGLNGMERHALRAWLSADPSHAEAFARADRARTELDWPLHASAIDEVLEGLHKRARKRRGRRRTLAASAALAFAVLAVSLFWRPTLSGPPATHIRGSTLVLTEPRRQKLPDGSIVELKNGSEIQADFSGSVRHVALKHGTAHFIVAKDPTRPFVVTAGAVAMRAVGTAFCVEMDTKDVTVLVTEGRVAVSPTTPRGPIGEPLALLDAGNTVVLPLAPPASLPPNAVRTLATGLLNQRLSWRIPRLEFLATPLPEVVAMINCHNLQQFVLADRALEKVVLSGVLRADNVDALVDMLKSEFHVRVDRRGNEVILHSARRK